MPHPPIDDEAERRNRERMLDETLEDSFPASDPLSTNPNPDNHGDDDREPAPEEPDRKPSKSRTTPG